MDLKEIKKVIDLVEKSDISSLSIETEGQKIEVHKHPSAAVLIPHASASTPTASPSIPAAAQSPSSTASESLDGNLIPIKSPMVGTFYRASKPDAKPFVEAGDTIKKGQTVCIIEAMKLFNEIESEVDGTVEKILIANAEPVEYGKALMLIRP